MNKCSLLENYYWAHSKKKTPAPGTTISVTASDDGKNDKEAITAGAMGDDIGGFTIGSF